MVARRKVQKTPAKPQALDEHFDDVVGVQTGEGKLVRLTVKSHLPIQIPHDNWVWIETLVPANGKKLKELLGREDAELSVEVADGAKFSVSSNFDISSSGNLVVMLKSKVPGITHTRANMHIGNLVCGAKEL